MENTFLLSEQLCQLGRQFNEARRQRNEKLTTVAHAIGVSHSIISQIEHGKYECLSMELLMKLAAYYNISVQIDIQ